MRNYIFVSYAHKDSERVLPVIKKLQENGYNVWYDDGIDPGTEWAKNISKHIVECSYFIAFMSQAYLDSKNCNEEWHFARDEEKKRFLVYIEEVKLPDDMRMRSSMIQNLFMHKYGDKEEFYRKLFAAEGIEICKNDDIDKMMDQGQEGGTETNVDKGRSETLSEETEELKGRGESEESKKSEYGYRTGSIKWFNNQKGFGFITDDKGNDILVHYSGLLMNGYRELFEGDRVEFRVVNDTYGPQACDVMKI